MITKKELLKKLEGSDAKISDRMLTHFISLGLIKKPVRFGLGKGKGSISEFDDRTFNDIKEILKLHEEGLTRPSQFAPKNNLFWAFVSWRPLILLGTISKTACSADLPS